MANKITKTQMYEMMKTIDEVKGNTEMMKFIDHEIALLAKKSENRGKTATKNQIANEKIKTDILATLSAEPMTVTEIIKSNSAFAGMSNQKISALINQLADSGKVTKISDKRVSRFILA